jgi:hypothetical protein
MADTPDAIPYNLISRHEREEVLRGEAIGLVVADERLQLYLAITEAAMDLADVPRQLDGTDEDFKVIQLLGMRTFNAFAASLKLALSGYSQNSALILRDILETIFLVDYFATDRSLITRWGTADEKARMKDFGPVKVRNALDARDGFTSKKRYETNKLFSELAGHPTMKSALMLRPQRNGDAAIGPFMAVGTLTAVSSEMGKLAVQVGEQLNRFFPADCPQSHPSRLAFFKLKQRWIATFYPSDRSPEGTATR